MFFYKSVLSILLLGIVVFCLSCSEDKSTGPNDSMAFSSSSFLNEEIAVSSSNEAIEESSSSLEESKESSSSEGDEITSSSSDKDSEMSSSSSEVLKESSSSEGDEITSSSSDKDSEMSSSSLEESKESSSSEGDEITSSSSDKGSEISSSSSEVLKESSSSEGDEITSSSSAYYKLSWQYLNESVQYDTIIDSRDNQVYKILTIGNQTWMAENLNYYDTIQNPELKLHSWCFKDRESNCELYGRLYDLSVTLDYDPNETTLYEMFYVEKTKDTSDVQGICPDGWRIPTQSDFTVLINKYSYKQLVSGGTSGFSVIINTGDWKSYTKTFISDESVFWTTTRSSAAASTNIYVLRLANGSITQDIGYYYADAVSVRCIKDSE